MIRKKFAESRMLALTYDDGPSVAATPRLLDLLREHGAAATFFMLGRNVKQHPGLVDRVLREGHDVGCHSNQHINAWKATPWCAVADIDAGYDSLLPWIRPDGMFRPPHGKMTLATFWALRRRKAPVWWWTIDSGDTRKCLPSSTEVVNRVLHQNGGIVLMHDGERSKKRIDFVIETTAALLSFAKREQFAVRPLSRLCR
ncbi:MAG: polysaccharide deacetylase family protein [Candidatus Acidiferrales bacterium]